MELARGPQARITLAGRNLKRLVFVGVLALYMALIGPTVDRLGIGWDEEVDLRIARAYLTPRGLLFGLPLDQSQTRLPMFSVTLVYHAFGTSNLLIARWTSVVVGGLTLLGTYVYGRQAFGYKVGLVAAALLALNPFFLSFARLAFTESDIYVACALIWLLVLVARLQHHPTVGKAAVAGVILGLCISSKATVLAVLPAVAIALQRSGVASPRGLDASCGHRAQSMPTRHVLYCAGWAVLVLLAGIYSGRRLVAEYPSGYLRLLHYCLVWVGWLLPVAWAYRHRARTTHPVALAVLITGLGLLTFLVFPPDHLTNPGILQSLLVRAEREMILSMAFMGELAALHLLTLFFKSTPAIGLSLLTGIVIGLTQWRRREFTLPLLIVGSYFAGLVLLPLGQTFYTVPILPVLSVLAAAQIVRLWFQHRRIAVTLALIAAGWWGVEMVQCYPDYHLNGYQWLGKRVLFGRSSIGYRSVVFTPADGVQQAVEWLNANAKPGEVAQFYVSPWHIVRYTAPDPAYQITNGLEAPLSTEPDYIVLHINDLLWEGHGLDTPEGDVVRYPLDKDLLQSEYEQVFTVERAFGLVMASVWMRK